MVNPESEYLANCFWIALAVAVANFLFARVGHYFAYRRGWLKLGYLLGLYFGPIGVLAVFLLPRKADPLLEVEWHLNHRTSDLTSSKWLYAVILATTGTLLTATAIGAFAISLELAFIGWFVLIVGLSLALFGLWLFRGAQPPLFLLPPLIQYAEPGSQEMLGWAHHRHRLAELERQTSQGTTCLVLLVLLALPVLIASAFLFAGGPGDRLYALRSLTLGSFAGLAAVALFRLVRKSKAEIRQLHEVLISESQEGSMDELSPDEVEESLGPTYERILRQRSGHQPSRAEQLAFATEEARDRTRQSLFWKPLSVLVVLWLLWKIGHGLKLASRIPEWLNSEDGSRFNVLIFVGAVILGYLIILIICRYKESTLD